MEAHQVDGPGQDEAGNTSDDKGRAESTSDTSPGIGEGHGENLQNQCQREIYGNDPLILEYGGKYGVLQHRIRMRKGRSAHPASRRIQPTS